MENKKSQKGIAHWLRNSLTARMFMIGFLIIVLILPLTYITFLIQERSQRQSSVVSEVGRLWGKEVVLEGPMLRIPYKTYKKTSTYDETTKKSTIKKEEFITYAYFFPETLDIDSDLNALKKKRGIYETSVFTAAMHISGYFEFPDFSEQDIAEEDILWEKAVIMIRTSNLKGIKNQIKMHFDGDTYTFRPKFKQSGVNEHHYASYLNMNQLESTFLKSGALEKTKKLAFQTEMTVNGSTQIRFIPVGKETKVHMASNWAHPSHTGAFLPNEDSEKKEDATGFVANWTVYQTNRQFEKSFFGSLPDLLTFGFGTELLVPVDEYQKSERSTKYGYLVISLTFLVFFLIQSISKINIHPFQYLLIGLALVMFYTLLISISEHQNFLKAYLISGSAVVLLISLYSRSILRNPKFTLLITASLSALYGFIFVIIQLENYALLVGSVGLFLILGMVMFASRKIDWSGNSQLT
ncbi:MAG: cell envelope integrity protein CreD [Bacteroidota bacterium]